MAGVDRGGGDGGTLSLIGRLNELQKENRYPTQAAPREPARAGKLPLYPPPGRPPAAAARRAGRLPRHVVLAQRRGGGNPPGARAVTRDRVPRSLVPGPL